MTKAMNHTDYPKGLVEKSLASLVYMRDDIRETLKANPEGVNVSYYMDELCYVVNEIHYRQKPEAMPPWRQDMHRQNDGVWRIV
jgi:hypothetical protein